MHWPFTVNRCVLVRTVFQLCVFQVQVYDMCVHDYTEKNIIRYLVEKSYSLSVEGFAKESNLLRISQCGMFFLLSKEE